jgi:hypothetical protein
MTAKQLVDCLRPPKEMCRVFHGLADTVSEARLADGQRLCDATDFAAWLRELAEETRVQGLSANGSVGNGTWPKVMGGGRRSIDSTCPRCGHIHQSAAECCEPLGGGRVCRCQLEVSA